MIHDDIYLIFQEDMKKAIVKQVVECFGREGSDPVNVMIHDWKSEDHIKGGPCNIMPPGRKALLIAYLILIQGFFLDTFLANQLNWSWRFLSFSEISFEFFQNLA